MNHYADILSELYTHHYDTWDEIAELLKQCRSDHPRSYWYAIATNRIRNPGLKEKNAIVRAANRHNIGVSAITKGKFQRKSITLSATLYNRLKALKTQNSQTWNELIESMLNEMEDGHA